MANIAYTYGFCFDGINSHPYSKHNILSELEVII